MPPDDAGVPGHNAAPQPMPVLASALRDGDVYSPDGTQWRTFCASPHLHQHSDPPAQHADPADTDIVHVTVTPLAADEAPPPRTRFVHRRQREQADHLSVADWPYRVCEISRVTATTVYYRPQDYSGSAWHADRARFADEVGGILGRPTSTGQAQPCTGRASGRRAPA